MSLPKVRLAIDNDVDADVDADVDVEVDVDVDVDSNVDNGVGNDKGVGHTSPLQNPISGIHNNDADTIPIIVAVADFVLLVIFISSTTNRVY